MRNLAARLRSGRFVRLGPPCRIRARATASWTTALLAIALAVGAANTMHFGVRAAARWGSDTRGNRERAATDVASFLASIAHQGGSVLLILDVSSPSGSERIDALAFEMRLRYLCYPRQLVALDVRNDAATRAMANSAAAVAYRTRLPVPSDWSVRRYGDAWVAVPDASNVAPPLEEDVPASVLSVIGIARLAVGAVCIYGLGLVILAVLGVRTPVRSMLPALAHLVGSVAVAIATTSGELLTGRVSVWPSYLVGSVCLVYLLWNRTCGRADDPVRAREGPCEGSLHAAPEARAWLCPAAWSALAIASLALVVAVGGTGLSWDGWAIWQLKARAFFHDGSLAILGYPAYDYAHLDYPILIPIHSWWLYAHAGHVNDFIAQLGGCLFAFDLVLVTYGLVRIWAGRSYALIGAALVACQPSVLRHAVSGYADVPLAAFVLFAAGLAAAGSRRSALALAIAAAGCAWTKNEGLAAALGVAAFAVWSELRSAKAGVPWARCARRAGAVIGSVALLVLPWWSVMARFGLRNDVIGGTRYRVVDALYGAGDHRGHTPLSGQVETVTASLLRALAAIGPAYPAWGLVWVVGAAGLLVTLRRRRQPLALALSPQTGRGEEVPGQPMAFAFIAMSQSVACLWAYLRTPHPLEWHLATSLDRLMLHVMPVIVVLACIALAMLPSSEARGVVNEPPLEPESGG
ncbi:MAG: hypothetical protein FJX72_03240 [Armatimonadetes bacterium]|nr:hypothetical protein [Armatimonadota bacterium]